MAKQKNKLIKCLKRDAFPRKAKEQSASNLEKLGVIMEVIEALSAVEDAGLKKKRPRLKLANKHNNHTPKHNEEENKSLSLVPTDIQEKKEDSSGLKMENRRSKEPVLLPNNSALSHFMELEERKDLLCSTPMDDPLGPDSFDNFQWVEVKQELPDDIKVCNFTLTELPFKLDEATPVNVEQTPSQEEEPVLTSPAVLAKQVDDHDVKDSVQSDSDIWNQDSSPANSSTEQNESENSKINPLKKTRKNHPQNCDICGKKLSSKGSLRQHKLKKHKQKVQFKCGLCGIKFDFQRDVVQHRNSVHRQEDGCFYCEVCKKRCPDYHSFLLHSLKKHQTLMHDSADKKELNEKLKNNYQEKNFVCHACGKRFAFICMLRDHINLHTGSKPYLCQQCGKSFAQKATLKQHAKTHSEIRPFQCPECPVGFYCRGDLKKHTRKHTGERPYVCEICGEKFSRGSHLGVHRRTHTGERPFTCDVCERGFTKKGDVVRHRRIHTGELPYLCQVCGKAFRQSTQCANHIKSQHPDAPAIVARNPNPLLQRIQSQLLC